MQPRRIIAGLVEILNHSGLSPAPAVAVANRSEKTVTKPQSAFLDSRQGNGWTETARQRWEEETRSSVLLDELPLPAFLLDPQGGDLAEPIVECSEARWGRNGHSRHAAWSLAWPVVDCSQAACRQNGYGRDELIGLPIALIGPMTDKPQTLARLIQRLEDEECVHFQGLQRRKDGTCFPVEVSMSEFALDGRLLVLSLHHDLTDWKQEEEETERIAEFARSNPSPVFVLSAEGKLVFANDAAEVLARSIGEMSPRNILPPGVSAIARECLAAEKGRLNLASAVATRTLYWSFFPDPSRAVVFAHALEGMPPSATAGLASTAQPSGQMNGATGDVAQDLREVLALVRGLAGSIQRGQVSAAQTTDCIAAPPDMRTQLVEAAPEAILSLDREGKILFFSPAAERLTGLGAREVVGKLYTDTPLLSEHSLAAARLAVERVLAGEEIQPVELEVACQDKSSRSVEANARPIRQEGKVTGVCLALWDITERKRVEEALRKSESSLALAQRISHVGSWELDLSAGRLEWSPEAFRIFDRVPGEFMPTREAYWEQVHPSVRDSVRQTVEEAVRAGKAYSVEYRIVCPGGETRHVFEQGAVHMDEAGTPVGIEGTVQDITKRKQLEEQLRHVEKWEAIGRLAGGVAHDFNGILNDIRCCTETIQTSPHINTEIAGQFQQLADAVKRATNLTWQLLAFSRRQSLQPSTVDLNGLIKQVIEMLHHVLGQDVCVSLKLMPDLPVIQADTTALEQVLLNLLIHSRSAMPKGGRLTLESRLSDIDAAYVQAQPEARVGRFIALKISDTGGSVDSGRMGCIYEPFFTSKEIGQGTGLGLATVYGIVKQHGGWIDVHNELGRGTIFNVYLPTQPFKTTEVFSTDRPAKAICGGTETILVAEDEPLLRALARSILQRYGYHILEAGSGPEAIAAWERDGGRVDLLLTDMMMPGGMNGRELAQQLRTRKPKLKILFMSGYSADLTQGHCPLKPGLNFLPKPYSATALAQAVRNSLDRPEADLATGELAALGSS